MTNGVSWPTDKEITQVESLLELIMDFVGPVRSQLEDLGGVAQSPKGDLV